MAKTRAHGRVIREDADGYRRAAVRGVAIAELSVATGPQPGATNNCVAPVMVGPTGIGTCTISATNTVPIDGPATATVTLAPGAGWALGSPSLAVGTITDDDRAVGVTTPTPLVDDGANAVFNITCIGAATATVSYSFSGSFTPLPPNGGPTVVTCGTPLVVTIPTADDPAESVRVLKLTLAYPTPFAVIRGAGSATVLILDQTYLNRPIPTLSMLGLMLLGLLVAAAGVFRVRKTT